MTKKEEEAYAMMSSIAKDIDEKLPDGMGFMLMAYEFGSDEPERRTLYVSNSRREDVMRMMVEFLEKNLENPDMYGKDE